MALCHVLRIKISAAPSGVYVYQALEDFLPNGSKNTLIYNLDVSLISDFLDSLMTESMIVAAFGTAETGGRRPIW